jgi:hypothetical protein
MEQLSSKLDTFLDLLRTELRAAYIARFDDRFTELVDRACDVDAPLKPGQKYVRVCIDGGSRYFVEISTGKIFGSASYKKPNLVRLYGTLDTINDWHWGGFYAVGKLGQNTLVPKEDR